MKEMKTADVAYQAVMELAETLRNADSRQVEIFASLIKEKKRIFVAGAGRSLLMLKAFAMRLMHVGFEVYIVGEVTTPAFLAEDLLVIATGSGETQSLVSIAEKAKSYGGTVAVLTIFEDSSIGKIADVAVKIPAFTDKLPVSEVNKKGILPGGSMFEEAVLLLGDALIVDLAKEHQVDTGKAFEKHANLE